VDSSAMVVGLAVRDVPDAGADGAAAARNPTESHATSS
jgi:hypothetical protein